MTTTEMSGMDRMTDAELFYWEHSGTPSERIMARELLAHRRASQAAPAPSDGLREENERLQGVLATIVSRCDTAKQQCREGAPVSAFNLACGILGQIGADRAALSASPAQEGKGPLTDRQLRDQITGEGA